MTAPARAVLFALGGYGLATAAAGVALVLGPTPSTAASSGPTTAAASSPPSSAPAAAPAPLPSDTPEVEPLAPAEPVPAGIPSARQATVAAGQATAFVPTQLVLPGGTRAPVLSVGVADDGSLVIPENPAEVGVWDGGAKAGDTLGSLVVAGHVDSRRYGLGVLHQLKRVTPGAVIELRDATDRVSYVVASVRSVNQQSLATNDEFFRQDVPHRLVVITCGGPFDSVRHRYRDNFIVLARPA